MITDEIATYLRQSRIPLRLACVTGAGWPLVLSLWYLYEEGALYCATLDRARVVAYLRQEPRCAFEVAADHPPYCGVRGQATARIDPGRGEEILRRLLKRYLGGTESDLARWLLSRAAQEVAIVLTPVTLTTWDYTKRMPTREADPDKICP